MSNWIPVAEKLPLHTGRYLVTVLDDVNHYIVTALYLQSMKRWFADDNKYEENKNVVAWQKLPTPYKESEEENE